MGAAGQFLLIRSLTVAEAGAVAPFGYAGVVFATLWGLVAFGEVPDGWTLLGALVIVGAGVYVWHRETRLRAAAAP
ncbi:MAG: DMT family transporter [Roseicyclus sp.]|nr:DMT family transporter [Roseicyclus sp.]